MRATAGSEFPECSQDWQQLSSLSSYRYNHHDGHPSGNPCFPCAWEQDRMQHTPGRSVWSQCPNQAVSKPACLTLNSYPSSLIPQTVQTRTSEKERLHRTDRALGVATREDSARAIESFSKQRRSREESFHRHLLSSFSYLIKALVSLSDPDRFLAILALLLGYSRAPALARVSFP